MSVVPSQSSASGSGPTRKRFLFKDTLWLGGRHDGYPRVRYPQYLLVRFENGRPPPDIRGFAGLFQSLLTFGLLESVMQTTIPEKTLLCVRDGRTVMTDETLFPLLDNWQQEILGAGKGETCRQMAENLYNSLMMANSLLMNEITNPASSTFRNLGLAKEDVAAIFYSIASIAEVLSDALKLFPRNYAQKSFQWCFIVGPINHYETEMMAAGWCPFIIQNMSQTVSVLAYASTCRPFLRSPTDHAKCTPTSCVNNNIDSASYKNIHRTQSCTCMYSKPPLAAINTTLEKGSIPIICSGGSTSELSVGDAAQTPYVAISHVWADGLGSTSDEGLPICQVARIRSITTQLVPGGAFWMDALCVPKDRQLRKHAIGLMSHTYRQATVILVLDAGIRSCSSRVASEEKLLRVLVSGWMQRLWTLQEGLLAHKLVFEFSDGLVSLDKLVPELRCVSIADMVYNTLATKIFDLSLYQRSRRGSFEFSFTDVIRSLRSRTTSKTEDEAVAIAGLLNLDAAKLSGVPPDQRMKEFLLGIENLPKDIILSSGVKLQEPGFRWAPETFLRNFGHTTFGRIYDAVCSPAGLTAEYAALCFPCMDTKGKSEWVLQDSSKKTYKAREAVTPSCAEGAQGAFLPCNALLMMEPPGIGMTTVCAAVFAQEQRDGITVCEYRRRLFVQCDPQSISMAAAGPVAQANLRVGMKVRVV